MFTIEAQVHLEHNYNVNSREPNSDRESDKNRSTITTRVKSPARQNKAERFHKMLEENNKLKFQTKQLTAQWKVFLWFIGYPSASFRDVSDIFDITISSLHRNIRRLTLFLSNLSSEIIKWPAEKEKVVIEQAFNGNGFSGIIGAMDGCHIKIDKPNTDPESYVNRKSYCSIQLQAECDNARRIWDIFVSCH